MSSQFGRSTRVAGEEGKDRARIQLALSIMAIIRKDRQGEEREEGSGVLEFTEGEIYFTQLSSANLHQNTPAPEELFLGHPTVGCPRNGREFGPGANLYPRAAPFPDASSERV